MHEKTKKLHDALSAALKESETLECTRRKGGEACTRQHEGKLEDGGRPVLFFNDGCKIVESFCSGCRAYWHIAVARNAVFEAERWL